MGQIFKERANAVARLVWLMTGIYALHVTIGIFLILIFAARACLTNTFVNRDPSVDLLGLYWLLSTSSGSFYSRYFISSGDTHERQRFPRPGLHSHRSRCCSACLH
jgi:hypothetical protein